MNILVVTGSRGDYGPLEPVHDELVREHHVRWVSVYPKVRPGSQHDVVSVTTQAMTKMRAEISKQPTGMVVLLGDRHEVLGAATAACIMQVPVAHLSGGDVSSGSQDECFRHAVTKLAHLHFPTCQESAGRILQMGEESWRVHMVGAPSADRVMRVQFMPRADALAEVGLPDGEFVLVCMHPCTDGGSTTDDLDELDRWAGTAGAVRMVLVGPNCDAGWETIHDYMSVMARLRPRDVVYSEQLESRLYLSLMKHCRVMVGNSSAMYYEAPVLGTRTVSIGRRQEGRTVVHSPGNASGRIAGIIGRFGGEQQRLLLLRKKFAAPQRWAPGPSQPMVA